MSVALLIEALLGYAIPAVLLAAACLTDLRNRIIPNWIPLALFGAWALYWAMAGAMDAEGHVLASIGAGLSGALVIGGSLLAFSLLFERVSGRASLGGGDIKLMAASALYLGVERGALCLGLACVLGVALAALIPHTRFARADEPAGAMPFGPAIAAATLFLLTV